MLTIKFISSLVGNWNEEQVLVKQGRFGYYVRCGKIIAGLRKLDPLTLTLEEGIEILETRGKLVGAKKGKKKGAKVTTKKVAEKNVKRSVSGYQIYVSEVMKNGIKMGEAASNWKLLNEVEKDEYKDKAKLMTSDLKNDVESSDNKKKKTISKKNNLDETQPKRPLSGYQIFVSEMMKNGMKMSEAATSWKILDLETKETYKSKVTIENKGINNIEIEKNKKDVSKKKKNDNIELSPKVEVKRRISGYQLYVSEVMKNGVKMGDAASQWKNMSIDDQEIYKNKARLD